MTEDGRKIVERALWSRVRQGAENRVEIAPNWVQLTSPGMPLEFRNGVFRCELTAAEADERVPRTIGQYVNARLPFRWKTCASSAPIDLADRLLRHGMYLKDVLFGFFAASGNFTCAFPGSIRVEAVGPTQVEDWLSAQASAWSIDAGGIEAMRSAKRRALDAPAGNVTDFVAYLDDRPVGVSGLVIDSDHGFLGGGAVDPTARRRGVYRAMVAHRMELLRRRGLPGVIHAVRETSAPICAALGFEKTIEIQSYEHEAFKK